MDALTRLIELFKHFHEGIYIVDRQRKILYFNPEAENISGYAKDEVIGKFCNDNILNHVDDQGTKLCIIGCPLKHSMDTNQMQEGEIFLHHKAGHRVRVSVKTLPYLEKDEVVFGIEVFKEVKPKTIIKEQFDVNQQGQYLDPLTEVYNRRYLNRLIVDELITYNEGTHGCLFVDIDNFKDINDTHGHAIGDQVIKNFTNTIQSFIKKDDIMIRYGGEEFVILVKGITYEGLKRYAESLRVILEASYIKNDWQPITSTASIGGVIFVGNKEITTALVKSDEAMYQAKRLGKNKTVIVS